MSGNKYAIATYASVASFTAGSTLTWVLRHRIYRVIVLLRNFYAGVAAQPKMMLVARTDLSLTPGKLASQCAHAAVSCYSASRKRDQEFVEIWEGLGQPKIVLRCDSESALEKLAQKAKAAKLISVVIQDAGLTQTKPKTKTVLGIGPAKKEDIDQVTGHLKLY